MNRVSILELQDLKYFCVAAELEHITRSAEVLGISQPFLSKVIQRLENELGTSLFEHRGRLVFLNEYGRVVYHRAKRILSEIDHLKEEIDGMRGVENQTVSAITNTMIYMPEILTGFFEEFPDYTIHVSSSYIRRIKKAMHIKSVDFALCSPPLAEDIDSGFKTIIVHQEQKGVLLPPSHHLRQQKVIYLSDLQNEEFTASPEGFGMREYINRLFASHNIKVKFIIETDVVNDIVSFVQKGMGCAFFPVTYINKHPELKDDFFYISDAMDLGPIGLSFYEKPYLSTAKRLFRDFVIDYFCGFNRI